MPRLSRLPMRPVAVALLALSPLAPLATGQQVGEAKRAQAELAEAGRAQALLSHNQSVQWEQQLADAHAQLLARDQRIADLQSENIALRTHLDDVLRTRVWRYAERYRSARNRVLGRGGAS